jgi:hypothetical protein
MSPVLALDRLAVLVKACLRRWSPSTRRCRKEEARHRAAWVDLWPCLQPFLEAYAMAMLRRYQIPDRSLADEIAGAVFESLATEPQWHVRRAAREPTPSCPAEAKSSLMRSHLRKYRNQQRRLGNAVDWDSLAKYLQRLVQNEVRKVARSGRHQWCSDPVLTTLQAPEPPVTEERFHEAVELLKERLPPGALLDTFKEEMVRDTLRDPPGNDGARRMRLTRLRQRVQELLEKAGLL